MPNHSGHARNSFHTFGLGIKGAALCYSLFFYWRLAIRCLPRTQCIISKSREATSVASLTSPFTFVASHSFGPHDDTIVCPLPLELVSPDFPLLSPPHWLSLTKFGNLSLSNCRFR